MTLLQKRDAARYARRLDLYNTTRQALRDALRELMPGENVILFGSITRRGVFNAASDVDVALQREPAGMTASRVMVELGERLNRRVDVVLLPRCRFKEKIVREGEAWTT